MAYRKKRTTFYAFNERKEILENLKAVNEVIGFDDSDGSCCDALEQIKLSYPEDQIIFCNGGDRGKDNTPEAIKYGEDPRVQFEYGIGGDDKRNSSSWILKGYFERQRKLLGI